MTAPGRILVLTSDAALDADVDRVAAAVGLRIVRTAEPPGRRVWAGAAAVLLDATAARRCAGTGLPRRRAVVLISTDVPSSADWEAAVAVGAERVLSLPAEENALVAALGDAADSAPDGEGRGAVLAVIGGRGGAGASVFATALARQSGRSLLVDGDPWGGGLDLVLGCETVPGLRWPDLSLAGGRVGFDALREALPEKHGVSVLSCSRAPAADAADVHHGGVAFASVVDAGSRAGVTVVCDVARRPGAPTETALAAADLVVVVTPADVRSAAAAAATAAWVRTANPNAGLVVRGPAPGGLRPRDVAHIVGLPVLASMRPEPGIGTRLEHGGLRWRRRSPLASAARAVLAVLDRNPDVSVASSAAQVAA
jgi:secretion/DNA translocation related CpaE-like protein